MAFLKSNESRLVAGWTTDAGMVVPNDTYKRIQFLTKDYLTRISTHPDGWSVLYRDPGDGRYWEYTYPDGDRHGGGAPALINLEPKEAQDRFRF